MSGKWIDQYNAVAADTVYSDGALVARDAEVTLPEITFQTANIQAMGPMSSVVRGLINDMTASITKVGIDLAMVKMLSPGTHNIEVRGVQNVISADGTASVKGLKAFIRGEVNTIPGFALSVGSASENEISVTVSRYQLFVAGTEVILIDRLACICRINGVDYYAQISENL